MTQNKNNKLAERLDKLRYRVMDVYHIDGLPDDAARALEEANEHLERAISYLKGEM